MYVGSGSTHRISGHKPQASLKLLVQCVVAALQGFMPYATQDPVHRLVEGLSHPVGELLRSVLVEGSDVRVVTIILEPAVMRYPPASIQQPDHLSASKLAEGVVADQMNQHTHLSADLAGLN